MRYFPQILRLVFGYFSDVESEDFFPYLGIKMRDTMVIISVICKSIYVFRCVNAKRLVNDLKNG